MNQNQFLELVLQVIRWNLFWGLEFPLPLSLQLFNFFFTYTFQAFNTQTCFAMWRVINVPLAGNPPIKEGEIPRTCATHTWLHSSFISKMAASMPDTGFATWISAKLQSLNVDDEVFGTYITSILDEEETSREEKTEAIAGILEEIEVTNWTPDQLRLSLDYVGLSLRLSLCTVDFRVKRCCG